MFSVLHTLYIQSELIQSYLQRVVNTVVSRGIGVGVGVGAAGTDETAEHLPEVHLAMTNGARRKHQDVIIDVVTSLPTGLVTLLTLMVW